MKKQSSTQEIVSFNAAVPAVDALIELDEATLDLVSGGQFSIEICLVDNCGVNNGSCVVNGCRTNIEN
ncbi:MAG TPA: hypothetical protein VNM90_16875 [Haliangium sp.]|nr:hypothetical protein [Haliangium sp.]